LLAQALGLYEHHHHTQASRVVLHKSSRYWPEELADSNRLSEASLFPHQFFASSEATKDIKVNKD
jgi:hypothetical protein